MASINDLKLRQLQVDSLSVKGTGSSVVPEQKSSFETVLRETMQSLQFSKHSQQRMEQRGIELTQDLLIRMNEAADTARQKGAKDVVMIDQQAAFIVSIPNNTVITAMSGTEMKQNLFTKIDGAVLL